MHSLPLVRHVLRDDAVTRGLGDLEARILVEWLADRAEQLAIVSPNEEVAWAATRRLCRKARSVARFVKLWNDEEGPGPAIQFYAAERLTWPLPVGTLDPGVLMSGILRWLDRDADIQSNAALRRAA